MIESFLDRASWLSKNEVDRNISDKVYPDVIDNVRKEMEKSSARMAYLARFYSNNIWVDTSYQPQRFLRPERAKITFMFEGDRGRVTLNLDCRKGKGITVSESANGVRQIGGFENPINEHDEIDEKPQIADVSELGVLRYILNWLGPDWN